MDYVSRKDPADSADLRDRLKHPLVLATHDLLTASRRRLFRSSNARGKISYFLI